MITQSPANLPILAGIAIGLAVAIFLMGFLMRMAVRIVARFTPSYGNVYLAIIVAAFAYSGTSLLIGVVARNLHYSSRDIRIIAAALLICFIVSIAVLGQVIKAPNGAPLGFIKAFLANTIQWSLHVVIWAALLAVSIGLLGYQKALNNYRMSYAAYQQVTRSLQARSSAGLHLPAISWVTNLFPSAQATPAPADRYYLNSPLVVRVSYGTITLPARTEVQVISQIGDSCQIEFAGNVYTVSRTYLEAVP